MKLYWPMATYKQEPGWFETLHTYYPYMTLDECKVSFQSWDEVYGITALEKLWVDVTDTKDESYKVKIVVRRDYIFEENDKNELDAK